MLKPDLQPRFTNLVRVSEHLWIKDETQQHSGAFKYRGAFQAIRDLENREPLVVASTGNFGIAAVMAGLALEHQVTVFLPETADQWKRQRIEMAGGKIRIVGANLEEASLAARKFCSENGWSWLSGLNDLTVIDGYRNIFREVISQLPDVMRFVVPVGGGGLLAAALMECAPNVRISAVESVHCRTLARSLEASSSVESLGETTIATGLAVGNLGHVAFDLTRRRTPDLFAVSDRAIMRAMARLYESLSVRSEPSGAAAFAAVDLEPTENTVCIITGGNILPEVFDSFVKNF